MAEEAARTQVALERPDQPEVIRLVDALDAFQKPLYPAESHHGIDMEALSQPNVLFAVARDVSGAAVGCAAVVVHGDHGELKRMYVAPARRGQGIGKDLLAFLERAGTEQGCRRMMLETGVLQPEAIGLYAACGYALRGPFAGYGPDPLSVFMEKNLVP